MFNEDRKQINGLLLVHLPDGPTAQFRLSNLVLSTDIKVGCGSCFWKWVAGPEGLWHQGGKSGRRRIGWLHIYGWLDVGQLLLPAAMLEEVWAGFSWFAVS